MIDETYSIPFPGLRSFEFEESHLFFGRDEQIEQLISKLGQQAHAETEYNQLWYGKT